MKTDLEIGRVIAVDTSQLTIEIDKDLKSLVKTTYHATYEVAKVNSYLIIPIGLKKIVAMINRVVIAEEAEIKPEKTMVVLPLSKKIMKATMIGTIEGKNYKQGIDIFPILDNPVWIATKDELDIIFDTQKSQKKEIDSDDPGYCIEIGEALNFTGYKIKMNPDNFFGKHAAIIGSTGSGKSCTIATVLQSVLQGKNVQNAKFVILDTNGEYKKALGVKEFRFLHLSSDPNNPNHLVIPYWFMNSEDYIRLFRAAEGVQLPVLTMALKLAKCEQSMGEIISNLEEVFLSTFNQILSYTERPNQMSATNIISVCESSLSYKNNFQDKVNEFDSKQSVLKFAEIEGALTEIKNALSQGSTTSGNRTFYQPLDAVKIQTIHDKIGTLRSRLEKISPKYEEIESNITTDSPVYFDRDRFVRDCLETAIEQQQQGGARARENISPMVLRIRRFFTDPRYKFLFNQFPKHEHSLATFLRDILGSHISEQPDPSLSDTTNVSEGVLPYYDRARAAKTDTATDKSAQIIIIDLSLLASEVLENVTALIGRLILEFLQHLKGEESGEESRGKFPVVLILEEAQNYINEKRGKEDPSISKEIFEKIAREGRKYGLGLVVASQRPSELSKTVLSQCNSFIVHRLQNPEDLRYFKEIVPSIYTQLLDQLPALAQQTAIVLGECVRAPVLVRLREANPVPKSEDPKFYKQWIAAVPYKPGFEKLCKEWEQGTSQESK